MASMLNISLPEQDLAYVESQTGSGHSATPSEYIHELIQDDRDRKFALKEMLLSSLADEEGSLVILAEDWEHGDILGLIEEHAKTLG
jgi:Arc/MetJ-type ribon-helix-helix transcriptional regulator